MPADSIECICLPLGATVPSMCLKSMFHIKRRRICFLLTCALWGFGWKVLHRIALLLVLFLFRFSQQLPKTVQQPCLPPTNLTAQLWHRAVPLWRQRRTGRANTSSNWRVTPTTRRFRLSWACPLRQTESRSRLTESCQARSWSRFIVSDWCSCFFGLEFTKVRRHLVRWVHRVCSTTIHIYMHVLNYVSSLLESWLSINLIITNKREFNHWTFISV